VLAGHREQDARWLLRQDHSRFWAQWVTEPVRDETGQLRGVAKVLRDETERQRAEEALRHSLAEKEELLKEVHHRVKNNLQVITSLINLQANQVEDERVLALFDETRNRVYSIATIHELIYRSASFAAIDLGDYARQLVPELVRFYGADDRVRVDVQGDGAQLELERAVPFGLLLNELVSNVCKHAFPEGRRGTLAVSLTRRGDEMVLEVVDTGVGLPEGFDYRRASSLGLQLVHGLALQLEGSLTLRSGPGTTVKVTMPARIGTENQR
jgi:two-component sensor histidine kinase